MKKFFFGVFVASCAFSAQGVFAASLSLSPPAKTVTAGDSFSVSIIVDSAEEKSFTAKAALSYPASLLRVTSFTFGDAWTPLNQPGYNEIHNDTGSLIKTGGYPGGFSSQAVLGTVQFIALAEGNGAISVEGASVVLNSESKNVLSQRGHSTVTIAAREVQVAPSAPKETAPKKSVPASAAKKQKPVTTTAKGMLVPERFSPADTALPQYVPSPEKAWLYTKLAFLSIAALILQYRLIMYPLLGIFVYLLFRIIRRVVGKHRQTRLR